MKHLSRNKPWELLETFTPTAGKRNNIDYILHLREYVWNRAEGRPFVAENPEKAAKADSLRHDTRLQDAIKDLVPQRPQLKSKTVM
jgi:hypothetical protein